jgi:hypothetical protein
MDLEALTFVSNPEFDDFRTSVTIGKLELAKSIDLRQSYS